MEIKVELIGLKGVEDALADAGPKLAKRALRKALSEGGKQFVEAAKSRAPVLAKASPTRKPGELREAIQMVVKLSGKQEAGTARIGLHYDKSKGKQSAGVWGSFVEFGSVHGSAQPFMRPGFDSAKNSALDEFTTVIRSGVESLKK